MLESELTLTKGTCVISHLALIVQTSKIPNIMGGKEYEAVHNPHKLIALRS